MLHLFRQTSARRGSKLNRFHQAKRLHVEPLEDRRMLAAGDLDLSFGGGDGLVMTDFSQRIDHLNDMALQADGKIVVAGSSFKPSNNPSTDMALARYNPDGSLDSSFDGDGKAITAFNTGKSDSLLSVAIQSDGKILGVGPSGGGDFAIVRYNSNGSLDNTFDRDGKLATNLGGDDVPHAVELDPSGGGKFIVGGVTNNRIALTRYLADGRLDTTFDGDGKVITTLTTEYWAGMGMAVSPSGIFAGYTHGNAARVAKFLPSGALDVTFGVGGVATGPAGSGAHESVLVQSDGKIVVTAPAQPDGTTDVGMLVRFNADGSLDSTFDLDGAAIYGQDLAFNGAVLQSDGKVIGFGYQYNHSPWLTVAVRFNIDGTLDTTYGTSGEATANFGEHSVMFAGVLQSDGRLVVGGDAAVGSWPGENMALARFVGDPPAAASSSESSTAAEMDAALMLFLMEDSTTTTRRK